MVTFYLPSGEKGAERLPTCPKEYWPWICASGFEGDGPYSWTLQTYLNLVEAGVECNLATEMPSSGIVIAHRDFLPMRKLPSLDHFVVCIKPDRDVHPWAHFYVLQNEADPLTSSVPDSMWEVIGFWPQPSLIPRDEARGSRVENVAYFGRSRNLVGDLKSDLWLQDLKGLGLNWVQVPMNRWNDYREIDVTVSIRGWSRNTDSHPAAYDDWNRKPATKLINSWLARVPAIVGDEPAYRATCSGGNGCLVVSSFAELKEALKDLKENPGFYAELREAGAMRAGLYSPRAVCEQWKDLIINRIIPAYGAWRSKPKAERRKIYAIRMLDYYSKINNISEPFLRRLRKR